MDDSPGDVEFSWCNEDAVLSPLEQNIEPFHYDELSDRFGPRV